MASYNKIFLGTITTSYMNPGGKVRAISRGDLARGDIARDPVRSRGMIERRDYARSRVHIINACVTT